MNTMALAFDSLQYAKKLQKAGFTEEQAEIQAEVIQERTQAVNIWIDENLATKQDLKLLRQDFKQDLTILEERLNNRINETSYQITTRLGSLIVGAVAV